MNRHCRFPMNRVMAIYIPVFSLVINLWDYSEYILFLWAFQTVLITNVAMARLSVDFLARSPMSAVAQQWSNDPMINAGQFTGGDSSTMMLFNHFNTVIWPWKPVITGYIYGIKYMLFLWVFLTGYNWYFWQFFCMISRISTSPLFLSQDFNIRWASEIQ